MIHRAEMLADVADFDPSRVVRLPQVDPVCISYHAVELVNEELAIRVLKPALVAVPLHRRQALGMTLRQNWISFSRITVPCPGCSIQRQ